MLRYNTVENMSKRRRVEGEVGSRRDVPSANESGEIPEDILAQLEKLERAYEDVNGYHVSRRAREELRAERQFDKLENCKQFMSMTSTFQALGDWSYWLYSDIRRDCFETVRCVLSQLWNRFEEDQPV